MTLSEYLASLKDQGLVESTDVIYVQGESNSDSLGTVDEVIGQGL